MLCNGSHALQLGETLFKSPGFEWARFELCRYSQWIQGWLLATDECRSEFRLTAKLLTKLFSQAEKAKPNPCWGFTGCGRLNPIPVAL
jgi:hypothetical protein